MSERKIYPSRPLSIDDMMERITRLRKLSEEKRDEIPVDADQTRQQNWHYFNGQVCAMQEMEAHLRLYKDTFPAAPFVEVVEPGKMFITLSNGEKVSLHEAKDDLHIGQVDPHGEDWWICSINRNGVLCAPNSGEACETLTSGFDREPEEVK